MTDMQKRFALFLFGCIPVRLLLVYLAKIASPRFLSLMGYIALIPAIGFAYLFLSGSRTTGPETFGAKIWWNSLRPVHSILYLCFAYSAIVKHDTVGSWRYLLADVLLGLASFVGYHAIG